MPGTDTDLLAQAGLWTTEDQTLPVLLIEDATGAKHDSDAGEEVDPLLSAVLGGGLRLVTDPSYILVPAVRGWQVVVDAAGTLTIEWPGQLATMRTSAFRAPPGWHETAQAIGHVVVLCGDGLGLREQEIGEPVCLSERVGEVASRGMLAVGAADYRGHAYPGHW